MIQKPNAAVVLARGLLKRCGRCGRGGLFSRWFDMADRCPRCGLAFERGEGYWLGAMAVNLGVTEAAFGLLVVLGALLTWPDVPWALLTVLGLGVNAVVPFAFYPFSKTIFVAIDLLLLHAEERTWRTDEEPELPPARAAAERPPADRRVGREAGTG